jgi:O-antigen/teichoic acid export membrane protein
MKKIKPFIDQFPKHWLVAASAWISKIIVSLVQIVSIRALLNYLGEDRYAIYVVAYSLVGWFGLAEFSVGCSIQNFISEARAKNQSYEKYLIAALQIISVLFVISVFLTVFISNSIQDIIFRKFAYIPEIQNINFIFFIGIVTITNALLGIVYRVYYALHRGYIPNIIPAIAAIISMISIVVLNRCSSHQSILLALLIFTLPQLIIILVPFIKIFKNCCLKILDFNFTILKSLFIRAIKFHGMIIISMAYGQTDYLVMSQTLSPSEIVTYNIFMRVFMFFSFIYTSLLMAFWPVSAEMYINNKFEYLKKTIKQYLIYVTFFMIIGTILIIIFSGFITKILAPGLNIIPTMSLLLLFGFYITIRSWQDTFVVFLQSINSLKIFWVYMPFQFTVNIFMQYFLSKKYGASGIVMGLVLSIILVSIWVLSLKTHKILNSTKNSCRVAHSIHIF